MKHDQIVVKINNNLYNTTQQKKQVFVITISIVMLK